MCKYFFKLTIYNFVNWKNPIVFSNDKSKKNYQNEHLMCLNCFLKSLKKKAILKNRNEIKICE